jgi:hypothetical protein
MKRAHPFLRRLVVAVALACPGLLLAEPVGSDAAGALARGWLAEDAPRPLGRPPGAFRSVETHAGYHVIHLEPEGYIITADDDEVEPVLAFADRGQFKFDPENPLCILLSRDVSARMTELQRVKKLRATTARAATATATSTGAGASGTASVTTLPTLSPDDEEILNEAARAQAKWSGLRQAPAPRPASLHAALTSMRLSGAALTNALEVNITTQPNTPVHLQEIRIADGFVQLTHDSPGSVTPTTTVRPGRSRTLELCGPPGPRGGRYRNPAAGTAS